MEKNTFKVDTVNEKVTLCHVTKTIDGEVQLETTFDIKNVSAARRLKRFADAELIAWRAKSGIKEMTSAEALTKYQGITVDCSKVVEKVKRTKSEKEKEMEALVRKYMAEGKSVIEAMRSALTDLEAEEIEAGEVTE